MSEDVQSTGIADTPLRDQLAKGNAAIADARPVLRHLLTNRDQEMFCDEVRARVYGMLLHLARQLLLLAVKSPPETAEERTQGLVQLLAEDPAFLAHAHALALEARLAEDLRHRTGFDTVVSPLIQKLSASNDPHKAGMAMRVLAAQARFLQQQRRMELPLGELPTELLDKALLLMRSHVDENGDTQAADAVLLEDISDQDSRLSLLEELVRSMDRDMIQALAVDQAGLAIFLTALSIGAGIDRTLAVYSCGDDQSIRLAVTLRATGLEARQIRGQILYLHPDVEVPEGIDEISPATANAMLAEPATELVG